MHKCLLLLPLLILGCGSSEPTSSGPARGPLTKEEQIADIQKKEMPASQKEELIRQVQTGQGRR